MTAVPPPAPTAPEGSGGTGYGTGAAAPTAFEPTASGAWAASGPAPTAYEPPVTGGASGSGEPAWLRANLPPDLQLRFEPLRSLNVVGGQADLIVCRDRERGGDEVVVKLYRYSDQLDRSVLAKLYQADPTHVVRLLDHGESHRVPWEAQEYCRNGTLADLRQRLGGRVPVDQLPHIVRELAEALGHIHALGITHRDFKPQNVLVRRPGPPPDLVLTDFGVAREQFQATQFTSISATFAWAAPEVHEGVLKAPLDWWALGATVFELLTGRHLLADASGRLPPDVQLRPIVMRGLYSTAQIPPGRWRDLVDGLLTHNPDRRWGYPQVDAWLRGDNPPVDRTGPALGRTASGQPGGALARLVFNGQPVISGVELAAAARRDWSGAARLMAGDIDPATREWLSSTAEGLRALQELRLETGAEARLVRLQGALDPRTPIQFRGRALTDQTLSEAMAAAARLQPDGPSEADDAAEWLLAVRDQRALRALAGAGRVDQAVGERLGRADLILDQWRAQTRAVARRVVDAELAELVELREKALIGQFFAIALGAAPAAPLVAELSRQIARRDTAGALWLESLAVAAAKLPDDAREPALGQLAAIAVMTEAVTADNERGARQAAARREAEAATARQEAEQAEREMRTARRRHVTGLALARLRWRGAIGAVYALLGGWALAGGGLLTLATLRESLWTLAFALAAVGLATLVDWLVESPASVLRTAMATAGAAGVGLVWLAASTRPAFEPGDIWAGPFIFAAAWILGDVLSLAVHHATRGRPVADPGARRGRRTAMAGPAVGVAGAAGPGGGSGASAGGSAGGSARYERPIVAQRRIAAAFRRAAIARAWVWVPVVCALVTAAGGLFLEACGAGCRPALSFLLDYAGDQTILPLDLPWLGSRPWLLGTLALAAWLAQLASRPLMRIHWRPGWAVLWSALALALVVVATRPDSPAAWLVGALTRLRG